MYHGEDRFISSDNGGTQACATKAVVCGDFATAGYWSTTTGQNLLKTSTAAPARPAWPNGWPPLSRTCMGPAPAVIPWSTPTAPTSPTARWRPPTAKFTGGDQQVLSAALSVYATSIDLAGTNVQAIDSHFNTSLAGSGMDTYNVGANGAAFGLANNTTLTVMQLLVDLNANTTAGAAVSFGANAVFSGINTIGNVTNAS